MAKLRGSKKHELNAIAETLRMVLSSYTSEQDLIDGIKAVIRTAEAWAANGKPTVRTYPEPLLHKTNVKRSCPHCGSTDVVMFTADDDWCRSCDKTFPGA